MEPPPWATESGRYSTPGGRGGRGYSPTSWRRTSRRRSASTVTRYRLKNVLPRMPSSPEPGSWRITGASRISWSPTRSEAAVAEGPAVLPPRVMSSTGELPSRPPMMPDQGGQPRRQHRDARPRIDQEASRVGLVDRDRGDPDPQPVLEWHAGLLSGHPGRPVESAELVEDLAGQRRGRVEQQGHLEGVDGRQPEPQAGQRGAPEVLEGRVTRLKRDRVAPQPHGPQVVTMLPGLLGADVVAGG